MHLEKGLQFKAFVPPLVDCLDHADGNVRESAKSTLIDLFKYDVQAFQTSKMLTITTEALQIEQKQI